MLHSRLKMHLLSIAVQRLGIVAQTFDAFRDLHKGADCCHTQNFTVHDVTNPVLLEKRIPYIRLQLLHTEREAPLLGVDCQHHCFYAITLLQYFGRMLHTLGPGEIAHMHQPVDPLFDLDECAEVGQVAYASFDARANRVFLYERIPGIRSQLPHPQ